ncbi:MAG: hypothetical protein V3T58_06220, partial [Candidatus Hydrothermarchaeales archaeon]
MVTVARKVLAGLIALVMLVGLLVAYQFVLKPEGKAQAGAPVTKAPVRTPAPTPSPEEVFLVSLKNADVGACLKCHDKDQTTSFHVPEVIMKLEEGKGLRRRLCIDCHGPLGPPWSADEQLTDPAIITYDEDVGVNGVFTFPNKVPHSVHQGKIDAGAMKCDTCHVVGGE